MEIVVPQVIKQIEAIALLKWAIAPVLAVVISGTLVYGQMVDKIEDAKTQYAEVSKKLNMFIQRQQVYRANRDSERSSYRLRYQRDQLRTQRELGEIKGLLQQFNRRSLAPPPR